jgi:hypothetical protein
MNETDPKRLRHHTPVLDVAEKAQYDEAGFFLIGLGANRGGPNKEPDPMNETEYDESTLGESEAGYSAAQRLLDEAVDQATP